jgi:hypothetical protein
MKFLLIGMVMISSLNLNAQTRYNWIAGNKVITIDFNGNIISERTIFEDGTIPDIIDVPIFEDSTSINILDFNKETKIKYLSKENSLVWENRFEDFYANACLIDQDNIYIAGYCKPITTDIQNIIKVDKRGKILWEKRNQELIAVLLKNHQGHIPVMEQSPGEASVNKQFNNTVTAILKTSNGYLLTCGYISFNYGNLKNDADNNDCGHAGWMMLMDTNGNIKWNHLELNETSNEIRAISETSDGFIAIGTKFKERNILSNSHVWGLKMTKEGKTIEEIETNEYGGPGISSVTTGEGCVFGIRDKLFMLNKDGQLTSKKIFYLGQNGKRNFSVYLKKLLITDTKELIVIADLYHGNTLVEKSIFKIDKDFSHTTWKKERRYLVDKKNIDQRVYTFKLFNNDVTKPMMQPKKADHKISRSDFIGIWLCDGCDQKYTMEKNGTFYGNDKDTDLSGTWTYDEPHQLLVFNCKNSKVWRKIEGIGDDYFLTSGYYFYRLD